MFDYQGKHMQNAQSGKVSSISKPKNFKEAHSTKEYGLTIYVDAAQDQHATDMQRTVAGRYRLGAHPPSMPLTSSYHVSSSGDPSMVVACGFLPNIVPKPTSRGYK